MPDVHLLRDVGRGVVDDRPTSYHVLLQLRAIKLILFWVLIVLPIIAVILTFVLAGALESEPTSTF